MHVLFCASSQWFSSVDSFHHVGVCIEFTGLNYNSQAAVQESDFKHLDSTNMVNFTMRHSNGRLKY